MLNTLLLLVTLTFTPQDGSLLFIEGGNRIVQNNTDSTFTHVAIILKENDTFWVYEAVKPKVRKIKLDDYYVEIKQLNSRKKKNQRKVWIANPNTPLTKNQKTSIKNYLEKQLGRKYSVASYLSESPTDSIHCCELVGEALSDLEYTKNPCADAPIDVWKKTLKFYKERKVISLD